MALAHHPDKNNNSAESSLFFRIIHQAYEILSNPEKKAAYDRFLESSRVFNQSVTNARGQIPCEQVVSASAYLGGQFNYLLWEIEDLLDDLWKNQKPWADRAKPETWILKILHFWDKWILGPNGFPDYFYQARKMETPGYDAKAFTVNNKNLHQPYRDIVDYFYQIRIRMNKFIGKIGKLDLQNPLFGYNITTLDTLLEAQRMAYYYIGAINSNMKKQCDEIAPYEFQHSCLGEKISKLPENSWESNRF